MSEPIPENETTNQKQARLRRERRNAKIQQGGSARLAAIMNSSGRQHAAEAETARPMTPSSQPQSGTQTPDPEIMDISEHHYNPRSTNRPPQAQQGRMPGFDFNGPQAQQGMSGQDDPMMAMLQQMMQGAGGAGGPGADPMAGMPPGLAQMFGNMGGGPGGPGQAQDQQQPPSSSAYLWEILHFIVSLFLALYITLNSSFTGSKRARDLSSLTYNAHLSLEKNFGTQLFYWFATAEVVLQSSRYFIERGRLNSTGLMGMLGNMLPEPWAGYVRIVGRYSMIYTTVVADAMVVVFVLGVMAWWKNGGLEDMSS